MRSAKKLLLEIFGYTEFRDQQAHIIDHVINGQDALVLMPTGGGKSLCYQLPSLVRKGTGVVISPLIALMQDQVQNLLQLDVKAAFLNSSLSFDEAKKIEDDFVKGKLDLLYVAPERLLTPRFLFLLEHTDIALFAIDEAHCVSQWGHDFRPDYVQLSVLHERFPDIPRMALTATADEPTQQEIIHQLKLENARQFISSYDRKNLHYQIMPKLKPRDQLKRFLKNHVNDAGIIYCLSRKRVDDLAVWLVTQGFNALPYHAGLDSLTRQQHQEKFIKEEGIIIVATVAFGMGIDKPNVRFVVHIDLPKSIEGYYQETGRAGRDGLLAQALLLYGINDLVHLRHRIDSSENTEQRKRLEHSKLNALLGLCETTLCRRKVLLNYFGESYDENCQLCDNCLTPVAKWEGKIAAQKALSCVYRTGQRFGIKYLIDVLLGNKTQQIENFNHHNVSTFGIGKEYSAKQWQSIFRQLISANLLKVDVMGFGSVLLTQEALPLLKGDVTFFFRQDSAPASPAQVIKHSITAPDTTETLWVMLKAKRLELAKDQGVPPYIIFHDSTLLEIYQLKPRSLREFEQISGVGERKLRRYGQIFIELVEEYVRENNVVTEA